MRIEIGLRAAIFLVTLVFFHHEVLHAEEKELLFFLSIDSQCATLEDDARLSAAIRARIPHAFIVRGREENAKTDWSIAWQLRDDATCEITIIGDATPLPIQLGPKASARDIDAVASQIAWISSFEEPITPSKNTVPQKNEEAEKKGEVKEEKKDKLENLQKELVKDKQENLKDEKKSEGKKKKEVNLQKEKQGQEKLAQVKTRVPNPPRSTVYDSVDLSLSVIPGIEYNTQSTPRERPVPTLALNLFGGSHIGLNGIELGLLWNHKTEFVNGLQLSSLVNQVEGPLFGAQLALVNLAGDESAGLQLGFANIATNLNGLQIGIINYGRITTYQLGLINIAEKSEFSLGIFNLNWSRSLHPTTWYDSENNLTFGFEHGSELLKYSILFSYFFNFEGAVQLGGGLGFHAGDVYLFSVDLFAYELLFLSNSIDKLSLNLQIKVSVGYRFSEIFSLFAGLSVNGLISGLPQAKLFFPDAEVIELDPSRDLLLWPGVHFGATF